MPKNHEKNFRPLELPQVLSHTHSANDWFQNDGQLLFDLGKSVSYEKFYVILLFLCTAVKPLLFWIMWEWAILDKQIFLVLGVVWFPHTPSNSHPQDWELSNLLAFGQSLFSAFERTVSQVPPASWRPTEDLRLFQTLKSTKVSFENGNFPC